VRAALVVLCLLTLCSTRAFATDFLVTKTADTADGFCNADCSLREAIIAANASPGADRVILGSGLTYTLTLGPADASGALTSGTGDLDITEALTIDGNGSTIDAALLDRVLDIQGSFLVTINNLTIKNGLASGFLSFGGGVNIRNATVVMNNCIVSANSTAIETGARDDGGGIAVVGSYNALTGVATLASLTLNNSTVSGNSGLNGGGILCVLCTLAVTNSAVSGNTASGGSGGGIDAVGNASTIAVNKTTLASNIATLAGAQGAGLSVPFGTATSTLTLNRIVSNTAATSSAVFSNAATVTATNNWWGCNFGPGAGGTGCVGTPNGVSGSVTSTPYLVLKTTASPPAIYTNASSTVTADLTFNSASVDTSGGGAVPNGIVAAFAGTLGVFATSTVTTTNGKATDVYTNSGATGSAVLSATVDGQTVAATVVVALAPPTVVTGFATGIGSSGATLNGSANPNALPTTAQFQYGTTAGYGSATPVVALGSGSAPITIGAGAIAGLACNTVYHFRAVATSSAGTANGSDRTFTTSSCAENIQLSGNLAFGYVRAGATATRTLTIANNGTGPLTVASVTYPAGFSGNFPNGTIAAGASQIVTVTFAPAVAKTYGGTITINGNQTSGTIAVSGRSLATAGDFDGDSATDITVFRPSTGVWYAMKSSSNNATSQSFSWGLNTDNPVPGDYDGDGKADPAVYRPSTGQWFILTSGSNYTMFIANTWGVGSDLPVPGDYDGDGKTDLAVFRPSTGSWYVLQSSTNYSSFFTYAWGVSTDLPVPSDYDGDGKTDLAVYRPSTGAWYVLQSSTNYTSVFTSMWGVSTDLPVPNDYDGDGKTDLAVYRPSTGAWQVLQSSTNYTTFFTYVWGVSTDIPVVGDYDGDGKADLAIYRPSTGVWYVLQSNTYYTTFFTVAWGVGTDIPLPKRPG
jgi:CSLREA domain-containing protein